MYEEEDEMVGPEIDVFPKQFGERFMIRLLEFKLKLQVNLGDEGLAHKYCNVSSAWFCPHSLNCHIIRHWFSAKPDT